MFCVYSWHTAKKNNGVQVDPERLRKSRWHIRWHRCNSPVLYERFFQTHREQRIYTSGRLPRKPPPARSIFLTQANNAQLGTNTLLRINPSGKVRQDREFTRRRSMDTVWNHYIYYIIIYTFLGLNMLKQGQIMFFPAPTRQAWQNREFLVTKGKPPGLRDSSEQPSSKKQR